MLWQIRDVEILNKSKETTFSLTGEYRVESVKGVEVFKYLRRTLDRLDEGWMKVLRNIRKA